MAKVLVLYYSTYGHTEKRARAVADGARSAGADVTVKRDWRHGIRRTFSESGMPVPPP